VDITETNVHSFIVKLWLEEARDDTERTVWHGYVTHVPDGERRYLRDLNDIHEFIRCYLGEMDDPHRRSSWLRRLLRRPRRSQAGRRN